MKLTPEAKAWYRSSMVWFMSLAGMMELLQQMLPQVQGYLPDGWYGNIQIICLIVAVPARFIRQGGMRKAVARQEAPRDE